MEQKEKKTQQIKGKKAWNFKIQEKVGYNLFVYR